MKNPKTLRWRLVQRLIPLQIVIAVIVLIVCFVGLWISGRLIDESGRVTTKAIYSALDLRNDKISLLRTSDVEGMLSDNPDLWFEVRTQNGGTLTYGRVPSPYQGLIDKLPVTSRILFDGEGSNEGAAKARLERFESPYGPVRILAGARTALTWWATLEIWTAVFLWVVAPMAVITSLVMVLAMPHAIQRGLNSGLKEAVSRIKKIDLQTNHVPLALDDAVVELQPFFETVNHAFERLSQGYKQQQAFLSEAAHELRTPIAILRVRLEALPSNPLRGQLLQDVGRLATLAEQLLDLQRLRHSQVPMKPVSLTSICKDVIDDLAPLIFTNKSSIELEISDQSSDTNDPVGDESSLLRAVTNLVQNSLVHAGQGCLILVRVPGKGVLEVHDSGPGIPTDMRDSVTTPFHRLKNNHQGAGLGLHLVSEVVRKHNGRLIITSSKLGGSCVRLCLPTTLSAQLLI